MPTLLAVVLAKLRVQQAQKVRKALPPTTLHTASLGAVENPGVLPAIPQQCPLALLLLALCVPQRSAEGAGKDPFGLTIHHGLLDSIL